MKIYTLKIDSYIVGIKMDSGQFNLRKEPFCDFFQKQNGTFINWRFRNTKIDTNYLEGIIYNFRSRYDIALPDFGFPGFCYFISKKMLKVLETELSLPPYQKWPIKYSYRNTIYDDAYFLVFTKDLFPEIDFEASEIVLYKIIDPFENEILILEHDFPINSLEDYMNWQRDYEKDIPQPGHIKFSKIVFNSHIYNYDLYPMSTRGAMFASERFKQKMEKYKIKKIRFNEPTIPFYCPPINPKNISNKIELSRKIAEIEEKTENVLNENPITHQEIQSTYKHLEKKLSDCTKYFQDNTLQSSINKYHDYLMTVELHSSPGGEWTDEMKEEQRTEYLDATNDLDYIKKIQNIESWIDNLEELVDARKVYKELTEVLNKIDSMYATKGQNYDTLYLKFNNEGYIDFNIFTDNDPFIEDEYRSDALDWDNFDIVTTDLMKNYVKILEENDIMDLEEVFEEIEYIAMMKKRLFYKSYLHLRSILVSHQEDLEIKQGKSPVFVFIMEEFEEDEIMELLYIHS